MTITKFSLELPKQKKKTETRRAHSTCGRGQMLQDFVG